MEYCQMIESLLFGGKFLGFSRQHTGVIRESYDHIGIVGVKPKESLSRNEYFKLILLRYFILERSSNTIFVVITTLRVN